LVRRKYYYYQLQELEQTFGKGFMKNKLQPKEGELTKDITERKREEENLIIANKELAFQNEEKEKRAAELVIANKELIFQNEEKEKRAAELVIANKELVFQNEEKEKRAAELVIANKELIFQNEEKEKRAAELVIANKELVFQNEEKEKRAAELIIANKDLAFQNEERKRVGEELRETHDYLENLLSFANAPIMVWDNNLRITRFNLAFERLTGYIIYDVLGKHPEILFPVEMREKISALISQTLDGENLISIEMPICCKNGSVRTILWNTANIYTEDVKAINATIAIGQDITERKSLQSQILQTQKVQSIGTLAGGIAHDFNNILGIILTYTSILERSGADEEKISKSTEAITQAVGRGAALVRQILTFARQTGASMIPLRIPDLIRELVVMLQETFPKVIEFKTIIEKNIPFINADQTQMHQVLLNLCVNARDAMPKGGIIGIEVKTVTSKTLIQQFPEVKGSRYLSISVSDTGTGMDKATSSRIFDPFFTTKEQGKGTGLGLSVVYGVIQEHYGFISVESTVGQGTTFYMYLPIPKEEKKIPDVQKIRIEGIQGGTETILFIEDERLLREIVQSELESTGYKVLVAADGQEAIEIYKKQYKDIALVLSDMGLPKLGGIDVYAMLKDINPNIKVICASGFISLDTRSELLKEGVKGFIPKPYVVSEVLQMVREVLNEK